MKFKQYIERLPVEIIEKLKATEQNPKYHAEGDVYEHTRMVFEECEKLNDIDLMVAAIFHDLGKIDAHKIKIDSSGNKKISHSGHEVESIKYVDKYFHLYEDLTKNRDKVYEIVKNHMRCHLYTSGEMKKVSKRKEFEENPFFNDIIKFTECDEKGRIKGE